MIDKAIDTKIKEICLGIAGRYEIHFVEIGTDKDHVHFLIQSVPTYSITELVTTIKSIIAKHTIEAYPDLTTKLWGSSLWTSGYYATTVGKHGNELVITKYVKEQGRQKEYHQLHKDQLTLF